VFLDKVVKGVLVRILLAAHEHHVLEKVSESWEVLGVRKASHVHAESSRRLFKAGTSSETALGHSLGLGVVAPVVHVVLVLKRSVRIQM
jgi:hypothetical protein